METGKGWSGRDGEATGPELTRSVTQRTGLVRSVRLGFGCRFGRYRPCTKRRSGTCRTRRPHETRRAEELLDDEPS